MLKWIQLVSQILIQYSVERQRQITTQIQEAPEKIKSFTTQAGIYLVGVLAFVAFALAAVIMVFVDLGHQWDADLGTHFSGTMLAASLLCGLGVLIFAIAVLVAKIVARKKAEREAKEELEEALAEAKEAAEHPGKKKHAHGEAGEVNPFMAFGEEFFIQLIKKLGEPKRPE